MWSDGLLVENLQINISVFFFLFKCGIHVTPNYLEKIEIMEKLFLIWINQQQWERMWSSGTVQDSGALDREFEPR